MSITKAWKCFPLEAAPYHLVVFADTRNQARYLAHRKDETEFLHMRARRFPAADDLASHGTAWTGLDDLPSELHDRVGDFWSIPQWWDV